MSGRARSAWRGGESRNRLGERRIMIVFALLFLLIAQDKDLEPGLVGEYFEMSGALGDFPSIVHHLVEAQRSEFKPTAH